MAKKPLSDEDKKVLQRFARKLKRWRALKGNLSQKALAERAGIKHRTVHDIENARHDPQFSTVLHLMRALRLSVPEFYSGDAPPDVNEPACIDDLRELVATGDIEQIKWVHEAIQRALKLAKPPPSKKSAG